MNLHETSVKEEISLAYIKAIIAQVRYNYGIPNRDHGNDLDILPVNIIAGEYIDGGCILNIQLKSTVTLRKNGKVVKYAIEKTDYNRLKHTQPGRRKLLVVLDLPRESEAWVTSHEDHLKLQKCAYYIFHDEMPEWKANNKTSMVIEIPIENKFTAEAARFIFDNESNRISKIA